MARCYDERGILHAGRKKRRIDSEHHLVLAGPTGSAKEDALAGAYPGEHFAFFRFVAVSDIEFEGACSFDYIARCAGRVEPLGIQGRLRVDAREERKDILEKPSRCGIAWRGTVADARIDEEDFRALLSRAAYEARPYLAFRENKRARARELERRFDEGREIKRIIDEHVIRPDAALGYAPAGGARSRKAELHARLHAPPLFHELHRHLHFADGDGVNPHRAAFIAHLREALRYLARVEAEPIAHARAVAAAPQHPHQKARQQKRKYERKD